MVNILPGKEVVLCDEVTFALEPPVLAKIAASMVNTGTPTAPTVTPASDSTTKLATTAFVQAAVAAGSVNAEGIQDVVGAMVVAGSGITANYNDTAGTLTITAAGTDAEFVRDTIGTALVATGLMSVTVNDAGDTITIATSATANASDAYLLDLANHSGEITMSMVLDLETTITALQSQIDALKAETVVGMRWVAGTGWVGSDTSASRIHLYSSVNDPAATDPTFRSQWDLDFERP